MAATSIQTDLLIGGTWRPAGDGARIDVLDPATGDALAAVADASPEDALAAVDAAAAAAPAWAAAPPRERAEVLRRGFELMRSREDEIAATITAEMGKPLAEARGEAAYAAEFLRWFAEEAVRAEGEYAIAPGGAARILVLPQPVGISVLITPWNFPAAMATRKLGPALAAGCTAIAQARHRDAADHAADRLAARGGGRCRRASSTSSPPRARARSSRRWWTTRASASCRSRAPPQVGRELLALAARTRRQRLDGARRQRAVPRPRGRGRRRRGRRRDGGEAPQRRRGLHGGEPLPRARVPRRALRGAAWRRRWPRCASVRAPSRVSSSAR